MFALDIYQENDMGERVAVFCMGGVGDREAVLVSGDVQISLRRSETGIVIKREGSGAQTGEKEISKIEIDDADAYQRIGVATGESLFHCLYLAFSYTEGFFEKVRFYHQDSVPEGYKMAFAFYGEPKKVN